MLSHGYPGLIAGRREKEGGIFGGMSEDAYLCARIRGMALSSSG